MTSLIDAPMIFAQTAAPGGPSGPGVQLIFIGLMFAAMYFLMIAPQRKKQKQHQKMVDELTTGDEVVTAGGVYGEITNKKDDRFIIRVAEGTKIEVGKSFIHTVLKKDGVAKK